MRLGLTYIAQVVAPQMQGDTLPQTFYRQVRARLQAMRGAA